MRVVHLVAWQLRGGATLCAYWLHLALRHLGVDSTILTNGEVAFDDDSVISLADSAFARLKFAALRRATALCVDRTAILFAVYD